MARGRSLFGDPTADIQELTQVIKHDLSKLNSDIGALKQQVKAQSYGESKHMRTHTSSVVVSLQVRKIIEEEFLHQSDSSMLYCVCVCVCACACACVCGGVVCDFLALFCSLNWQMYPKTLKMSWSSEQRYMYIEAYNFVCISWIYIHVHVHVQCACDAHMHELMVVQCSDCSVVIIMMCVCSTHAHVSTFHVDVTDGICVRASESQ